MPIHGPCEASTSKNYAHIRIGELIVISMVVKIELIFFFSIFLLLLLLTKLHNFFSFCHFNWIQRASRDSRGERRQEKELKWRRWRSTKITIKMYQMKLNAKLQPWKYNKWKYLHEKRAEKEKNFVFNKNLSARARLIVQKEKKNEMFPNEQVKKKHRNSRVRHKKPSSWHLHRRIMLKRSASNKNGRTNEYRNEHQAKRKMYTHSHTHTHSTVRWRWRWRRRRRRRWWFWGGIVVLLEIKKKIGASQSNTINRTKRIHRTIHWPIRSYV